MISPASTERLPLMSVLPQFVIFGIAIHCRIKLVAFGLLRQKEQELGDGDMGGGEIVIGGHQPPKGSTFSSHSGLVLTTGQAIRGLQTGDV